MFKKLLFIIPLFLFFAVAISAQPLIKGNKIPADLVITLERGPCFGACPVYTLTITADGKVTFDGKRFTAVSGEANGKISKSKIRLILKYFDTIKFMKMKDRYATQEDGCTTIITDVSSQEISITANGITKKTYYYFGCGGVKGNPGEKLSKLGQKIDLLTNSKRWAKSTGVNPGGTKPSEGDTEPLKKP